MQVAKRHFARPEAEALRGSIEGCMAQADAAAMSLKLQGSTVTSRFRKLFHVEYCFTTHYSEAILPSSTIKERDTAYDKNHIALCANKSRDRSKTRLSTFPKDYPRENLLPMASAVPSGCPE